MSGHRSDAVDCYAITSEEQREKLCSIIAEKQRNIKLESVEKDKDQTMSECSKVGEPSHGVPLSQLRIETDNISVKSDVKVGNIEDLIGQIVRASGKKGKTVIRKEIEITHE